VAGLNHTRHQVKLSNHVKAVRGFLEDSGFSSEMVRADVVKHKDSFWNKYYAGFVGDISDYGDFFTRGQRDSVKGTKDAFGSKSRAKTMGNGLLLNKISFQLKYYPSRSNSVGLVQTGIHHIVESAFEVFDGIYRENYGRENYIYDMHGNNSNFYLNFRRFFK